jgi:excisionase family DNA binding protein
MTPQLIQIQQIDAETLLARFSGIEKQLTDLAANQRPLSEPDELLTRDEVAGLLKISKVTVWEWSRKGILQPYRIGNKVRFKRSEVLGAAKAVECQKGGVNP